MAKLSDIVTLLYFLSLVLCMIALIVPSWAWSEEDIAPKTVEVVKRTVSGLWWLHDTFEVKEHIHEDVDDNWKSLSELSWETSSVHAVRGLLCTAAALLFLCFIWPSFDCCFSLEDKSKTKSAIVRIICGLTAGSLIGIGLAVYATEVKDDQQYGHLLWGFWLALSAAGTAVVAAIMGGVDERRQKVVT